MNHNAVVWFELNVHDMERAKKFYEAVFAVTLEKADDGEVECWMFPCKEGAVGASGALFKKKPQDVPVGPGGTTVYFSCEDCSVEEARAAANGGTVIVGKKSIGQYGHYSIVCDTEGNHIGLHSMK